MTPQHSVATLRDAEGGRLRRKCRFGSIGPSRKKLGKATEQKATRSAKTSLPAALETAQSRVFRHRFRGAVSAPSGSFYVSQDLSPSPIADSKGAPGDRYFAGCESSFSAVFISRHMDLARNQRDLERSFKMAG